MCMIGKCGILFRIIDRNFFTSFTDITNQLGNGYVVLPAEALLYCYGALAKDEKARRISLEMLESFAIVGVTVNG